MPESLHMRRATREIPAQQRSATFSPASFNEEDNTVDVVLSSGARVPRYDVWSDSRYEEELLISPEAVDMSRIDAGSMQVLDNHDSYGSVRGVIGIVTRAWIENGQLVGTVRLSSDPAKAGMVSDIKAGVLRALSVGYKVARYEVTDAKARADGGSVDLWRATRWTPHEVSFVQVPADAASTTRSDRDSQVSFCEFIIRGPAATHAKEPSMHENIRKDAPENIGTVLDAQPVHTNAAPDTSAASDTKATAMSSEMTRAADLVELCTRHAVPHMAANLIRSGASLEAAKSAILDAIVLRDAASGGHHNTTRVETVRDEGETRLRGMEDALYARLSRNDAKLDDNARQYRHMSLLDMGREHMERCGLSTRGLDRMQLATQMLQVRGAGMQVASDFGVLFNNVAHRRLASAYTAYPATYAAWARQGAALTDFKPVEVISMGSGPELLQINEHGEYKYGTFGGRSEQYKLATYGRIVAFTRQAIINDDLRVLDRGISLFGTSARRLENRLVYEQLTTNARMADGKALFHNDHGNLLTGAASALSLEALQAARAAMRLQKNQDGDAIAVAPKYLIVPAALETKAYQLTSKDYTPAKPGDVNDFRAGGRTALEVIVEPLLDHTSATAWYLASDTAVIDTVEYAYLDGAQGPITETRTGFEVDGTEVKCRLDFAAKALDWRGLVKANGA